MIPTNGYRENMLNRFKLLGPNQHFHKTVYRNNGVRKDAERFSLVDPVLDGEYYDPESMRMLALPASKKKQDAGVSTLRILRWKAQAGRALFQAILFTRFCTYYGLHLRYRP